MISYTFGIFASSISRPTGPSSGFVHWRILVDDKNDPAFGLFVNLGEVNFRTTVGVDAAMNGTLSASTVYDTGYEADKAVDGVNNTYWACTSGNWSGAWWRMSTPTARDVKEVMMKAPNNNANVAAQMPQSFRLQASEDGVVWVDKMKVVGETGWAQNEVRTWRVANTIDSYVPITVAAHRYWSINVFDSDQRGYNLPGLAEIEFRATVGGPDLTVPGGPITLSTTPANGTAADMIDNNTSTRCQWGGVRPARIAYDFVTPVVISEIAIAPNPDLISRTPADYTLDYSDDGTNWTTLARAILPPGTYTTVGTYVAVDFTPPLDCDARYWMMDDIVSLSAASMAEIELRATRGGADITSPSNTIYSNDVYGSGYEASYAFDNNLGTFWAASKTTGGYITIDLGSGTVSDVRELKLTCRNGIESQAVRSGSMKFSKAARSAYWLRGTFAVPEFVGPQNGKTLQLAGEMLPAGWQNGYIIPLPFTTDVIASLQNNRRVFNKALFNSNTKQIRLTLTCNTTDTDIVDMRAGLRGASVVGFESDPVIVTVGGKSVFTLPANGAPVVTDPINLAVDGTKDVVVSFRASYDATRARLARTASASDTYSRTYVKSNNPATTESGVLDGTGYNAVQYAMTISKIEWNVAAYEPPVESGHRYWRIKALTTPSGRTRANEVEFKASAGGADLTTGGVQIGPTGQNPEFAFDNDTATMWRSTANSNPIVDSISIGYNFGQKVNINTITMLSSPSGGSGEMMTSGWVQYSDDGYNTWTNDFYVQFDAWADSTLKTASRTTVYDPRVQKIAKHVIIQQKQPTVTKIAKHIIVKAL